MSEILRSWKEIASYAGASVRTLQRWEREFHLPIRRIATKKGAVVFAFRSDLDTWFRARTQTAEVTVQDEHFRMMFMNSPLPSVVVDNARKILDLNDAFCELLGLERTELMGRLLDMLSQGSPEYDDQEWNHFLEAGASLGQRNGRCADGSLLAVEYVIKSVFPGLNVVTIVASHAGGVPRQQVYSRLGRHNLSI
jgi:PAS domain S-box-containing protein